MRPFLSITAARSGMVRRGRRALQIMALGLGLPLCADEVTVQLSSFAVPELTLGLEMLGLPPERESAFFDTLVRLVATGEAELVLDHRMTIGSGSRAISEAIMEYTYPTEFEPGFGDLLYCPTAFETRNVGTRVEVEATTPDLSSPWNTRPSGVIELAASPKRVRLKGLLPIEFPNASGSGPRSVRVKTPLFLSEEISTSITAWSDEPVLLGLTRPADLFDEHPGGAGQKVIVTFARASTTIPSGAKAPGTSTTHELRPIRLHTVTVRAPRAAAAEMLWRKTPGNDEQLLESFLDLVRDGSASISGHAAVATRSGQRAKAQAIAEMIYQTEIDLTSLPTAFETRNVGSDWEVEPTLDAEGGSIEMAINVERTSLPVWRRVPIAKTNSVQEAEFPDFLRSSFGTSMAIPPGGVRWVGAVTHSAEEALDPEPGPWLDVTFVKAASRPGRGGKPVQNAAGTSGDVEATVAVFSLDEAQAQTLPLPAPNGEPAPEEVEQAVAVLWDGTRSGTARLVSYAGLAQRLNQRHRIQAVREWVTPEGWRTIDGRGDTLWPDTFEILETGTQLEMEMRAPAADRPGEFDLTFSYDLAAPEFPSIEAIKPVKAAEAGAGPEPRRFTWIVKATTSYTPGVPRIVGIEKSPAPPGHPEHGRWLVAVVKVGSGS